MRKIARLMAILIAASTATACTITAPIYTANYAAVVGLKEAQLTKVTVTEVTSEAKNGVDSLSIRGSSYKSPYGSFTAYFKAALEEDLGRADLLNPSSKTQIRAVLLRNELDGSGFKVAYAEVEANLVIEREGAVVYDGTKKVRHEWPSNFLGDIAIQRAAQNYPIAVRKLLAEFYADPKLIAALERQIVTVLDTP